MKKKIFAILGGVIILLAAATFVLFKMNTFYLELSVPDKVIYMEYGVDSLPEIKALCKGTILNRKGTPVDTTMDGTVDLTKLGSYSVSYTAKFYKMTLKEDRTIIVQDTTPPTIELISIPEHYTSPVGSYVEEGFTAFDNYDGDLSAQVISQEQDGVVNYSVTDSSGNTATATRTIIYKDIVAPTITLTNGENVSINVGKPFSDPGFVATDDVDGDLTKNVTVDGYVDGRNYGTYVRTYRVADSSGNICEVKRTVKIGDFSAPVISLKGASSSYIKVGTAYSEPGYSASDNIDGDITSRVQVSGSVNTSKMGSNIITYKVSDNYGNTTTATRTIFVYEKQAQANPVNPGDKVVYLTFDDGPSKYTSKLLDILDKYGVKATFFVTNQFPSYQYMIGETHRRGHTIALHTYSHVYSKVYASENAYYDDLSRINDIVVKQTGVSPSIVRFPGGTSNTVSRKYTKEIMTSLSKSLSYHGYLYCDWNVSSGDAGGAKTTDAVASNVISGIKKRNVSVVLQHDISSFSVNAVEKILFWGIQNGYTFLPMSDTTPMVHFKPQN